MKIHPVGAELFHMVGRTDRHDNFNSHFLQFCKCAYLTFKIYVLTYTVFSVYHNL